MVFFTKLAASLALAVLATLVAQLIEGQPLLSANALGTLGGFFIVSLLSFLFSPFLPVVAEKLTPQRETGKVKWFNANKGYGFITRDSGDDVFVHFRSIRGKGRRSLVEGQLVEFSASQGEKGDQADDVRILNGATADQ